MTMATRPEPSEDPLERRASLLPPRSNRNENERKRVHLKLQKSPFFKVEALVHRLRPSFIEVLQTPDFRNCKAAHEIRKQMKVMMDLYKQMTPETDPRQKLVPEHLPLRESMAEKAPSETKRLEESVSGKEEGPVDLRMKKSYIVGNSYFGWNFITFTCREAAVYYGETKESYRSRHKKKSG